jgi:hypothetical protein
MYVHLGSSGGRRLAVGVVSNLLRPGHLHLSIWRRVCLAVINWLRLVDALLMDVHGAEVIAEWLLLVDGHDGS